MLPDFSIPTPTGLVLIAIFSGYGYAVWRYELFALVPTTAAESIVTTMSDALLLVNPDRTIASGNRAAQRMLGLSDKELCNKPIDIVFGTHADKDAWAETVFGESQTGQTVPFETWLKNSEGKGIPVSLASSELFDERGNQLGYLIIARDMTERMMKDEEIRKYEHKLEQLVTERTRDLDETKTDLERSQEQLRQTAERLVEAKEEESARIARELHDELGQILTGVRIDLKLFNRRFKKGEISNAEEYVTRTDALIESAEDAIHNVQRITRALRPVMLDQIGLIDTLEWMVRELEERTGLEISFEKKTGGVPYNENLATAVYRIVQEALGNAARHSGANKVSIELEEGEDAIRATISDDGIGISDAQTCGRSSFGILGMRERARSFGGRVHISGAPGEGTTVEIAIPIA